MVLRLHDEQDGRFAQIVSAVADTPIETKDKPHGEQHANASGTRVSIGGE